MFSDEGTEDTGLRVMDPTRCLRETAHRVVRTKCPICGRKAHDSIYATEGWCPWRKESWSDSGVFGPPAPDENPAPMTAWTRQAIEREARRRARRDQEASDGAQRPAR